MNGRRLGAAFLASTWTLWSLAAVNTVAPLLGWWSFSATGPTVAGAPADLWFAWALLWGPLPLLLFPRAPLPVLAASLLFIDVHLMPALTPTVQLGDTWLVGELVALATAFVPAQLFGRWTAERRHLEGRVALHLTGFTAVVLVILPAFVAARTGGAASAPAGAGPVARSLWVQALALAALPGLMAVREFAERGGGTPVPFDPPQRLVTSGPYAYVSNPMQLSFLLYMTVLGACMDSPGIIAAGAMAVVFGAGFAAWSESSDLDHRFGGAWQAYRNRVPSWVPRVRPYAAGHATLYIAEDCAPCQELSAWLKARRPAGMQRVAAEDHPTRALDRLTYDPGDGTPEVVGLQAFARALEHLHIGWAVAGMTLRLPVLSVMGQWLMDAAGAGPRPVTPRRARLESP